MLNMGKMEQKWCSFPSLNTALLLLIVVIWHVRDSYDNSSKLFDLHWSNHTKNPVSVRQSWRISIHWSHYIDVIMTTVASQTTSLTVVYSIVYSGADQWKYQSSASPGAVNSSHKGPVTWKMVPFDDVIMRYQNTVHRTNCNSVHISRRALFMINPYILPHRWLPLLS